VQGTGNFYRVPDRVLDVNLRGVLNVADACAAEGVRRLLFSSSSECYGVPDVFPTPETEPLVVPDPTNPRWSYGGSKIAGELVVVNWARRHGFEHTIVRYHNVYGPAMGWDHVIPQFIRRLERGEEFTVQGDGEQARAFCYVDDAVAATLAAIERPEGANEIFNIGNPAEERTINELVALLARVSGKEIVPRHVPFAGEGTRRRVPDVERARRLLGFAPAVTLEQGLTATYRWYAEELAREEVRR
jgi:dTDP-glucose 4,6-dehydratase/UDP-glucose 4-epimerase